MVLSRSINLISRYLPLAGGVIKAHLLGLVLLGIALLSTGYTLRLVGSYFRLFNIDIATLLDGEVTKTLSSRALQYQLIDRINKALPKESVIMVFRVADFSFYGKLKYISYLDEKIADHVKYKTPDDVWHYLRQKGISHIYLPPYSLPSYYNSGLEGLLASPSHSTLLYDFAGFRLFEIRKNLEPTQMTTLIGEDFKADPDAKKNWVQTPRPRISRAAQNGAEPPAIVIPGLDGLLSNPDKKAIAYRGKMKFDYSPLMNKLPYNFKDNGIYRFQATVGGTGFLKIFLLMYHHKGTDTIENPSEGYKQDMVPLWAGVLNGGKRAVQSIFAVFPKQAIANPMLEKDKAYRLVFELGSRKSVQIYDWSMKQVHYTVTQPFQAERLQRSSLAKKGWHLNVEPKNRHSLNYGLDTSQARPSIFIRAQDSRVLMLESPAFYNFRNNPDMTSSLSGKNRYPKKSALFDPKMRQSINFSFVAKGKSVLDLTAKIQCQEVVDEEKEEFEIILHPVALSSVSRTVKRSFYSPCAFKYARLQIFIKPDGASANGTGQKPAAVSLQDLAMAVKYIGIDQKVHSRTLKEIAFPVEYYQ